MFEVGLLGEARVRTGRDWLRFSAERPYQLLAYLAYKGEWVGRDQLAFLFWPDHTEADARRNLRKIILRAKEFEWARLEAETTRLRWLVDTDVAEFHQAIQIKDWAEAAKQYGGALLEGMDSGASPEFVNWLELERQHLHSLWREALLGQADQLGQQGKHQEAATVLRPLLEPEELDEEALGRSMQALSRAGRSDAALWVYQEFEKRLNQQMGLEPSSKLQALAQSLQSGTTVEASKPASQPQSLPALGTAFVGRELELSELNNLLAQRECRLLTLTGPGGVGKTRTALKAAQALGELYSDGVVFVPLEALNSPAQIEPKIAEALGLSLSGKDEPLVQLIRHLGAKKMLLVLDNLEHLLAGVTQLAELLKQCPGLKMLTTSRERLALEEEWLLPLEGLRFPSEAISLEEALGFEAVQLFAQRAHQVKPSFVLTETDLPAVLEICRLTLGLPLALELAAAWVRVLPCAEIAQEIRQNLDFLTSQSRDLPVRQQSLRATFEYSWKLLSPKEQEALPRLSVFRGGFTREAAMFVAEVSLPVLASLADKSLLRVDGAGRYQQHPLLHQLNREKLTEQPGARQDVGQRHQEYFFELLGRNGQLFRSARQKQALDAVQTELENLHLAWQHVLDHRNALALASAVVPLARFYQIRGLWREGVKVCERAGAVFDPGLPAHKAGLAVVLSNQAMLHTLLGEVEPAIAQAERSLELFAAAKKMHLAIGALNILGILYDDQGQYPEAKRYFQRGLAVAQKNQDQERIIALKSNLALVDYELGNYSQARQKNQAMIEWYRAQQDLNGLSITLSNQGDVFIALGEYDRARYMLEEGLKIAEDAGIQYVIPQLLISLGIIHLEHHEYPQAQNLFERALHISREAGTLRREAESLNWLGSLAIRQNRLEAARHYLQRALRAAHTAGFAPTLLSALIRFAELTRHQQPDWSHKLLSLVVHHPAAMALSRDNAKRLLKEWKLEPIRGVVSLEQIIAEILQP